MLYSIHSKATLLPMDPRTVRPSIRTSSLTQRLTTPQLMTTPPTLTSSGSSGTRRGCCPYTDGQCNYLNSIRYWTTLLSMIFLHKRYILGIHNHLPFPIHLKFDSSEQLVCQHSFGHSTPNHRKVHKSKHCKNHHSDFGIPPSSNHSN